MKVVSSRADLLAARSVLTGTVGFVPTMGALHAGHAALLYAARAECDRVVTSNFVNPTQFGPDDDFARYPRTFDADLTTCRRAGVDLVWAPTVADVYPHGALNVGMDPGPLGDQLEGAVRPGHFAGVLTVVAKLLNLIRPDRAYFGEKDYQQLTLIMRMVLDLDIDTTVVGVPTIRDLDGLAMSSRNVYLSPEHRSHAIALSRALFAGRAVGPHGPAAVLTAATDELAGEDGLAVDYLELRGADLGDVPEHGPARLLVAARIGGTRLIDNLPVLL